MPDSQPTPPARIPIYSMQSVCLPPGHPDATYSPEAAGYVARLVTRDRTRGRATAIWLSVEGSILGGHLLGDGLHDGDFPTDRLLLPLEQAHIPAVSIVHPHRDGPLTVRADDLRGMARVLRALVPKGIQLKDWVVTSDAEPGVLSLARLRLIPVGKALQAFIMLILMGLALWCVSPWRCPFHAVVHRVADRLHGSHGVVVDGHARGFEPI